MVTFSSKAAFNAAKTKEDLLAKQEKGIKLTEEETESLNKALATLKGGWDEYYNSLSPIERAMTNIGTIFEAIGEMFQYSDTEFIGMSEGMAERLKEMGLYEFAINVGEWIVAIKNFFAGLWEGLQPLITTFKEIFNTLKDSFMAIWDTLKSAIESIFGSFNAGGQEMSSFANIGKTVAKIITMVFKPLVWILQLIAWVIRNLVVPVIQFFIKIMTPFCAAYSLITSEADLPLIPPRTAFFFIKLDTATALTVIEILSAYVTSTSEIFASPGVDSCLPAKPN